MEYQGNGKPQTLYVVRGTAFATTGFPKQIFHIETIEKYDPSTAPAAARPKGRDWFIVMGAAGGNGTLPPASYTGSYEHPACGVVEVSDAGGDAGLRLRFRDGRLWDMSLRLLGGHVYETRPLNPAVADYFPVPLRLRFEVERGKVVAMVDPQARYLRLGNA